MPKERRGAERRGGDVQRRNRTLDVMDAAVDIFWQKGYAASSVQDVADAVGVLKGSLYHYIDSKEDLLFRILEDVHTQSRSILDEVVAMDLPPLERLRIYMERHVQWYLENLKEVSVYFRDWRYLTGERLELAIERRRGYDRIIRGLIADAQAEGSVDPSIDPKYASFFLLAAVNHVPDWYRPDGKDPPSVIAKAYADLSVGTLVGAHPRTGAKRPATRTSRAKKRTRT